MERMLPVYLLYLNTVNTEHARFLVDFPILYIFLIVVVQFS